MREAIQVLGWYTPFTAERGAARSSSSFRAMLRRTLWRPCSLFMKGICIALLCSGTSPRGLEVVRPSEARAHVGELATVCGSVVDVIYLETGGLLIFDRVYPEYEFAAFVPDEVSEELGIALSGYFGADVCVHGRIEQNSDYAEIWVLRPKEIHSGGPTRLFAENEVIPLPAERSGHKWNVRGRLASLRVGAVKACRRLARSVRAVLQP